MVQWICNILPSWEMCADIKLLKNQWGLPKSIFYLEKETLCDISLVEICNSSMEFS